MTWKKYLAAAFAVPNIALTPGATVQVSLDALCKPGYTSTVRHVSSKTRKEVFKRYGMVNVPGAYEVDHWIPLEIGGANDITNLWPQPWPEARKKDVCENFLHKLVCTKQITLTEAQTRIKNWERELK